MSQRKIEKVKITFRDNNLCKVDIEEVSGKCPISDVLLSVGCSPIIIEGKIGIDLFDSVLTFTPQEPLFLKKWEIEIDDYGGPVLLECVIGKET